MLVWSACFYTVNNITLITILHYIRIMWGGGLWIGRSSCPPFPYLVLVETVLSYLSMMRMCRPLFFFFFFFSLRISCHPSLFALCNSRKYKIYDITFCSERLWFNDLLTNAIVMFKIHKVIIANFVAVRQLFTKSNDDFPLNGK